MRAEGGGDDSAYIVFTQLPHGAGPRDMIVHRLSDDYLDFAAPPPAECVDDAAGRSLSKKMHTTRTSLVFMAYAMM